MDFIKTMLVYMLLVVGSATETGPAALPAEAPTAAPAAVVETTAQPEEAPAAEATDAPTVHSALVATLPPPPTAAPTPAPTPVQYTALYVGDRGEDVRRMQRALTDQGFLNSKVDGIFGQKTKKAVEDFQKANGLPVDGVAGQTMLKLLYEGPDALKPQPTEAPATEAPVRSGVKVPIYYVDENEKLLAQSETTCFTTTTIYANSSKVGADYALDGENSATVTVRDGVATPASVTFRYARQAAPTDAPKEFPVPVYYMSDTGMILYQASVSMAPGSQKTIEADTDLVPAHYTLSSEDKVQITMDEKGLAFPSAAIFTFRGTVPTPAPGEQAAVVPVRYMNEAGMLLNESVEKLAYGESRDVEADPEMVEDGFRLVSESSVTVAVDEAGTPVPAVVIFTYKEAEVATEAPTAVPTRTPSPMPTEAPTPAPTKEPTEAPATKEPTDKPTEQPTTAPTAAPTPEPTAAPTAEPTAAPTAEPTPEPTATPAPTEEPVKLPAEGVLQAGDNVLFNGKTLDCPWYWDAEGRAMISVSEFGQAMDLPVAPEKDFFLMGAFSTVAYENGRLQSLKIAGKDCTQDALYWKQNLYIGEQVFSVLGCTFTVDGDTLAIRYK